LNREKPVPWVVVIASSAGGIDALTRVLSGLPTSLPASVVVVQHLRGDRPTRLHEHLARHSLLTVRLAEEGANVEAGVVYLATPGLHLRIEGSALVFDRGKTVHYVRPSADILFSSAAQAFGSRVIGVVLSGTGRDGALGCQEIKIKGGATIAQKDAPFPAMPQAAVEMGAIDFLLPLLEISNKIIMLTSGR